MGSYLQSVKDSLFELVDALEEEIENAESGEDAKAIIDDWKKEAWKLVEDSLKTSFNNGRKLRDDAPQARKRFRSWRKKAEGAS